MLRELELKLPKETVKYHFRRWTVRQMGIPRNKSDFYSDSLFAESENPVRIFFLIVNSDAYNGNYNKNPFNLARKWSVTIEGRQNATLAPEANNFQQQLNHMQEMLNVIMNRTHPDSQEAVAGPSLAERGKGPLTPKSSFNKDQTNRAQLQPEHNSMFEKLSNLLLGRGQRSSTEETDDADFEVLRDAQTEELLSLLREKLERQPAPTITPRVEIPEVQTTTKTFWLTKCQLELNSQMVDQLESSQTEDQAVHDFLRLYSTNQMVNSLFTCSISYDAFMNGYHIVAYDLTSSQDGGSEAFVNPSVRVGT